MSLVWLELLELMKGRSGVALTQFNSSCSSSKSMTCEVDGRGALTSSSIHIAETHRASMCICAPVSHNSLQH